jgi:dihydrofolate reductase
MGRKTFESLPKGALPNRRNIVLSRSTKELPGCDCYPSLKEALAHCQDDEQLFIIGGASIYRQTMPIADRLYLTEIDNIPEKADAFFPPYDEWIVEKEEKHTIDERHQYNYSFVDYVRP